MLALLEAGRQAIWLDQSQSYGQVGLFAGVRAGKQPYESERHQAGVLTGNVAGRQRGRLAGLLAVLEAEQWQDRW